MSPEIAELDRGAAPGFDEERILSILKLNPRDPATQALVLTCQRYGLDPLLKHAVIIEGRLYVTRDGLLHVAHRSRQLDGIQVVERPILDGSFWTATVSVYRKDMSHPFTYVGRFPEMRKVRKAQNEWRTEKQGIIPFPQGQGRSDMLTSGAWITDAPWAGRPWVLCW
jgi:hypothetical protein